MKLTRRRTQTALALLLGAALCGCSSSLSQLDEEKEPHFLEGKSREQSMDYKAAIESFEDSLGVNPRSGAAHFELAYLYDQRDPDPAASIYHYESYLKIRPNAENADLVRGRISALKQDLARTVAPLSANNPAMQREIERLAEENRQLRDEVEKWRAFYANRNNMPPATPANQPPGNANSSPVVNNSTVNNTPAPRTVTTTTPSPGTVTAASSTRTYKVLAGDTPAGIARKYSIKLDALMSANPGLNPTRMKVGQTLNIPTP